MFITAQAARTAAKCSAGTSVKCQAALLNLAGYDGNWRKARTGQNLHARLEDWLQAAEEATN